MTGLESVIDSWKQTGPALWSRMRELTFRSMATGTVLGAMLAASNLYMGLKTGWTDSGNITATLLSFAFFSKLKLNRYTPLENNITQSFAVVAGFMSASFLGPIAARVQAGMSASWWALVLWAGSLGTLGVLFTGPMFRQLIVRDNLPFPTGVATATIIQTIHAAKDQARGKLKALFVGTLTAALYVWFRDGRPSILPAQVLAPGEWQGISWAGLSLGLSCAPMLVGAGGLVGLRAGVSVMGGALFAWALLGHALVRSRLVEEASYGPLVAWLVWPGMGLILGSSAAALFKQRQQLRRAVSDSWRALKSPITAAADELPSGVRMTAAFISLSAVLLLGAHVFDLGIGTVLVALALSVPLTVVCARSAGQTDLAPTGAAGQASQLALAGLGTSTEAANLAAASVVPGIATQVAAGLWCLRSGQLLNGSVRRQLIAQLAGCWFGALVSVPVFLLLVHTYTLGSAALPAPGAAMFKAMAGALTQQGASLPPYASVAAALGLAVGFGFEYLSDWRLAPTTVALGVGFIVPASYSAALFLGAAAFAVARRFRPQATDELGQSLASGAIAGESLMGIAIAALTLAGVFSG